MGRRVGNVEWEEVIEEEEEVFSSDIDPHGSLHVGILDMETGGGLRM